jgi:hypothetical protein
MEQGQDYRVNGPDVTSSKIATTAVSDNVVLKDHTVQQVIRATKATIGRQLIPQ